MNIDYEDDNLLFAEEVSKEEMESEEIPKEKRTLRTQAYDMAVSSIVEKMSNGDIILNPEYQRNYIWDNKKASLLVESLLVNIPIPVIYASEDEKSKWSVVDGLQRLNSLKRFFNNEFKLTGLEILTEFNNLKYEQLIEKAQRILRNGMIRFIVIFNDSHPEIKYDIFMRLNRGSITLNEQELRNCLYRGKFNDLLKELRKNNQFLKILDLAEPHKRMNDAEIILRYFAISENYNCVAGKLEGYKGKLKTFLNNFMESNKHISKEKLEQLREKFDSTISKVYSVFGSRAFRRILEDNSYENTVNRAVMDFIMVSFENYELEQLTARKNQIVDLLKKLPIEDTTFNEAITWGTYYTDRVEYRLSKWINKMNELMGE